MVSQKEIQLSIAKRVAQELKGNLVVNLGIGIPLLIPEFLEDSNRIFFHTENGMLGIDDVTGKEIDPHLVNAGKLPIAEQIGASYFDSATSFGMIRGGHVDVAILGALQVDENGRIANWAIPGKNIIGVGGAMDLLVGAKKIIVTMTHQDKYGNSKILKDCTFPLTSNRQVDLVVTDKAVFEVKDGKLTLIDLLNGCTLDELKQITEATFALNEDLKEMIS